MLYGTNASGPAWTSPTMPLHTFGPSLSLCLPLVLPVVARHLHQNHEGVEEQAWTEPKRESHVGAGRRLSCSGRHGNKVSRSKIHSAPYTALTSILSLPLTCKRIAERRSRSGGKNHDRERQTVILTLPRLSYSEHA